MKSIRLSLLAYFFLLQLIALGAAGWLVYQTAEAKLAEAQLATYTLLSRQYRDQGDEIRNRVDQELQKQAWRVARLAHVRPQFRRHEVTQYMPLGLLTSGLVPSGYVLAPVWSTSGTRSPLHNQLLRRLTTEIVVQEDALPRDSDYLGNEYHQINSEWSTTPLWRSRSLVAEALPFDPAAFSPAQALDSVFDDTVLPSGSRGRRVQLKVPVTRFRLMRPPGLPQPTPSEPEPPLVSGNLLTVDDAARADRTGEVHAPFVVIQCACETELRDRDLDRLNVTLTSTMDELVKDGEAARGLLLQRLALIIIATFVATAVGAAMLVKHGLEPLRRLGDAVSRVSPRNFTLQLDQKTMPNELEPIAERLHESLNELRSAFEREKQAVADISHELRTPVAALLATLDVTLRKPRSAEEYRQAMLDARLAGGQLRTLVERLLSLARLDAKAVPVKISTFRVAETAEQIAGLIRPLAAEKGLAVSVDAPSGLSWSTDADKFREVLINLMHNSVQYNRAGGSITLQIAEQGDWLVAQVRDTGIGIAPDQVPHLFERFYRADPSREEAALHAGLGLAIVRGYLDLLGGDIHVQSQVNEGTTFRVRFPRGESPRQEAA